MKLKRTYYKGEEVDEVRDPVDPERIVHIGAFESYLSSGAVKITIHMENGDRVEYERSRA